MNDRYVTANIRLPLRVNLDGSTDPLPEYMTILIEQCEQLPTDPPTNNASDEFACQLQAILNLYKTSSPPSPAPPPLKMTIKQNELNNRPVKPALHNTSFKSKRPSFNRHTVKNHPSS